MLNHMTVLCNVFGPLVLPRLILLKMPEQLELIKPFMVMLSILPGSVRNVCGRDWVTVDTPMDQGIVRALRDLG